MTGKQETEDPVEPEMDSAVYFLLKDGEELGHVADYNLARQLLEALEKGLISEDEAMQFIEGEASQDQYDQLVNEVDQ